MGFFDKLKKINIFASFGSELTDDFYDELEESLILADTGMDVTLELVDELRSRVRSEGIKTMEEARECMCRIVAEALNAGDQELNLSTKPSVVLFIGVNGVGKTTTIGKIGYQLKRRSKKVLFCAADTFRAAAAEQLTVWADRAGVDIIKQHEGADPAAVVFDATTAAKARLSDVVLVDKLAPRLGRLDRFDMVVFRYRYRENRYYIKRIIALPGETVQISNGKILINGEVLEEPYGIERIEKAKRAEEPVVLGEDEYFVLGDNRNHSSDSRDSDIGNLARDEIIGRVMIRIWPWSKIGTFPANESCDGAE